MLMSGLTMETGADQNSNSLAPPPTMRRKPSIAAKVSKRLSEVKKTLKNKQAAFLLDLDVALEEDEPQRRYVPERLETLCSETGLSKQQLRALYRAFKEACPNGAISEPIFRNIYCQIFPLGDGNGYAHYIFKALDKGKTGDLTFSELVRGLTGLVKGSLHERLHWVFRLYDIDHDGEISREEMSAVIGAIHDLIGPSDCLSERHTDLVFQKLDLNCDGVITMDEFMEYCYNDEKMCQNFAIFDGSWALAKQTLTYEVGVYLEVSGALGDQNRMPTASLSGSDPIRRNVAVEVEIYISCGTSITVWSAVPTYLIKVKSYFKETREKETKKQETPSDVKVTVTGLTPEDGVKGKTIAIRREDQSVWERRAAFPPASVRRLTRAGVKVIVQPSNRRAYPMQTYANAGAIIQEDISEASVIFGVKQVPVDQLLPEKTYCLFSHTIKAQEANMPLLDAILAKNIRLIDYEKLMDESGQRVVAFGKYAGVAGMVNILHGLGLRLLALGHHTPFMHIGPAHNYRNSMMARQAIRDAGYEISLGMMPRSIGPITVVFTGSGNVSQGCQEVFQELPHEYVPPDMLKKVAEHGVTTKIYGCEVRRRHHLERKEGGGYDHKEYDEHPERYISTFSKKIAPYASMIMNGIYWAVNSPKLLTIPDAKTLLRPAYTPWLPISVGAPALPHRMLAICDISADPGGSIEFMNECTTIDTPFCLYDADRNKDTKSFKGPGVLVCSIDNMPTQLPRESTDFFGELLYPYSFDIIRSDATKPLDDHNFCSAVHGAIIASNGDLTPNFQYIKELRAQNKGSRHKASQEAARKKVVVLGSGYVSAPAVEYLHRDDNVDITVASALKEEADSIASRYPGVESVFMDIIERPDILMSLVDSADVVISLLPYNLHHLVAECCIKTKTNMVTASYCSKEMKEMHQSALDSGITVVNEVGLDPGVDHLLAMECFEEIRQGGGRVESFVSYCGGLPAPECSDNPLRYKFSWSPRGVLLNTLGNAKYLQNGKIIEVAPGGGLMKTAHRLNFLPGFALEGFANRDSTTYIEAYGIHEAHTVLRGTLRYQGFSDTIIGMQELGLLSPEPKPALHPNGPDITWKQLVCLLTGVTDSTILYENLRSKVGERVGEERLAAIERLGFLENDPVRKLGTPLDTVSHFLSKKLVLEPNDRDIVILRHEIGILWPDGRREKRGISLVIYGSKAGQGHSAMSKTVGFPAAMAAKMVLDGEIQRKGMVSPVTGDIYRTLLSRLRAEGFDSTESSEWL